MQGRRAKPGALHHERPLFLAGHRRHIKDRRALDQADAPLHAVKRLIRHLWLFLAVAEEQNFGRAAKRLGMSQPPLSEQIQVLEQALKVTLFERSRRGAKLTPVGAAILPAVRKFAEQLERLELAVEAAAAGES